MGKAGQRFDSREAYAPPIALFIAEDMLGAYAMHLH